MKKILIPIILLCSFATMYAEETGTDTSTGTEVVVTENNYQTNKPCPFTGDIASSLDGCLSGSDLVNPGDGMIEGSIKNKVVYWTTQLAGLLALLAVGAIVYGALMMTISGGEDEKIKKGKDIVKWAMLGFLGVIVAGGAVRLVVEVVFSVAG